ncbi:quinone oxidoreductase family protein [Rhodobacter ferrooxidans]|uniref:Alcohol dehydrogenase zinc-binding domain protein n=1 Tax=Rhodobacter ferrooxidans TaxID=371731 RepID=C8RZY0_9RHOB|nr:quinone oxidoreductase [Rhodobacter sp. SW2]EEW25589.1 Alcohol dehydrogenase zinc-binding domain protein [Rhodobacter sp. SW2]
MDKALIAYAPGGPEVMQWQDLATPAPGPGEVLLRQTAIGVNFLDVYHRSGLYPWATPTMIPGAEAAGVVEAVGPAVTDFVPGDRVAYVLSNGAYRQRRVVPAERLLALPDGISDVQIAGALLKGLTAQYLVNACYAVQPGDTVLVHAAAGGVGLLLGQWLKALGATAIGTAGSAEKVALARQHGYAHVINYRSDDFVAAVRDLTAGQGVAAVYDSVGQDTWAGSLQCLRRRGMFVSFGQASGMIQGFALADLAKGGSLSATRPVLFDFIASRAELMSRSADLFARLASGSLQTQAPHCRPLQEAAAAHADLEARRTTGSSVLLA